MFKTESNVSRDELLPKYIVTPVEAETSAQSICGESDGSSYFSFRIINWFNSDTRAIARRTIDCPSQMRARNSTDAILDTRATCLPIDTEDSHIRLVSAG